MDQPSGRSFMQVLCEKYSPENFPYRRGPGMGVHVPATPQGSPMKDRLNLPSVLVLNSCGITCAGDEREIAAFCAHVSELDLSDNKLEDWHEVSKIVSNVPQLEFLNLSSNPLNLSVLERTCAGSFSGVRKLVLNNSKASWETVHTILQELPDLEELFLCLNDYETVSCSSICCHSLKLLHITDNNLQDWTEIRKLGVMFPSLDTLVLANNHLNAIEEPDDSLARLFPNLRSISLHKSGLQSWEDIDKLNSFPKLEEVRLLGIPLLQPYTTEERRKLVIASGYLKCKYLEIELFSSSCIFFLNIYLRKYDYHHYYLLPLTPLHFLSQTLPQRLLEFPTSVYFFNEPSEEIKFWLKWKGPWRFLYSLCALHMVVLKEKQ
ncbi:tubulin-specific chaperone cofactor E-like protein isoform X2 [Ictidomys tridecemlineatus]